MRMGLHRHGGRADGALLDYARAVQPPIMKYLDPGSEANAIAAALQPLGVEGVGRVYFRHQYLGAEGARQIREVVARARACPSIRYWELHNEAWDQPGDMARYAELTIDFFRAIEAIGSGQRGVGGCFSQGTPECAGDRPDQEWREYAPALEYAALHGHLLGLHEYSGPHMAFELTWHCLRYRRALAIIDTFGPWAQQLQLVITEAGIDDVWGRPGPQGRGYKALSVPPWDQAPASPWGDYPHQLYEYGKELGRDARVRGWTDFGWADESGDWGDFDLSTDPATLASVRALQLKLPRGVGPGGSTPPPPTPPPPGGTMDEATKALILQAGLGAQCIRINPAAALMQRIRADGLIPLGSEADAGGYIVQPAGYMNTTARRVYYVKRGDWGRVGFLPVAATGGGSGGGGDEPGAGSGLHWPIGAPDLRSRPGPPPPWVISNGWDQEYNLTVQQPGGGVKVTRAVHTGLDIVRPGDERGDPVYAVAEGVVVFAGLQPGSWGRVVLVQHPDGLWSQYAHLQEIHTTQGARVARGQVIATVGDAGGRFVPHLHFELRRRDLPAGYWPSSGGRTLQQAHAIVAESYVDPVSVLGR